MCTAYLDVEQKDQDVKVLPFDVRTNELAESIRSVFCLILGAYQKERK